MRPAALLLLLVLLVSGYGCGRINARNNPATTTKSADSLVDSGKSGVEPLRAAAMARVDFATQVKPIFEARCQPCHFSGGKVYAKMPFDRADTIRTMGTKLFTRIKDENERRVIRDFLAQE